MAVNDVRVDQAAVRVLTVDGDVRVDQAAVRVLTGGTADVRVAQAAVRVLSVPGPPDVAGLTPLLVYVQDGRLVAGLSVVLVYSYDESAGAFRGWGIPWQ